MIQPLLHKRSHIVIGIVDVYVIDYDLLIKEGF